MKTQDMQYIYTHIKAQIQLLYVLNVLSSYT